MAESPTPAASSTGLVQWCLRNPVELAASLICAAVVVVVFLQVLFRYALHAPLDWAEELAMVLFQWVSFVGAGLAVRRGFHFHVDLVVKRLPERAQAITALLGSVSVLVVAYVLIHVGIRVMQVASFITLPVMHISKAYVFLAIPVGGVLMIWYQIPITVRQIRRVLGGA